jgi:hypothetical protein
MRKIFRLIFTGLILLIYINFTSAMRLQLYRSEKSRCQQENVLCQSLTLLRDKLLILARTLATPKTKPKTKEQTLVELVENALTYLVIGSELELVETLKQLGVPLFEEKIIGWKRDLSYKVGIKFDIESEKLAKPDYRASLVQFVLRNRDKFLSCARKKIDSIHNYTSLKKDQRSNVIDIKRGLNPEKCPICQVEDQDYESKEKPIESVLIDTICCSNLHAECEECLLNLVKNPKPETSHFAEDTAHGESVADAPDLSRDEAESLRALLARSGLTGVKPEPLLCPVCRCELLLQPDRKFLISYYPHD